MENILTQPTIQPFVKLAQSNMDLLTNFSQSPEVTSQSLENANSLFKQAQQSTTNLFHSNAFSQMLQGMFKNYTEFMTELTRSGMAILTHNQETMVRQAEEASENVIEATDARGRRARQAA